MLRMAPLTNMLNRNPAGYVGASALRGSSVVWYSDVLEYRDVDRFVTGRDGVRCNSVVTCIV